MTAPSTTKKRPSRAGAGARTPARASRTRIGLALAGGGPLGAIYEIGALCALEESLRGLDLTRMDGYVGVSAGAFIAAALANGMTARELCSAFIENDGDAGNVVDPDLLLKPAWGEFAKRLAATPKLAAMAGWDYAVRGRSKLASLERLGRALPTGLFDGTELQKRLAKVFDAPGRTNDFRRLNRRLVLVATALDTGEAVPFGLPGHDHVPISVAVQASGALPGMFPPVTIDGQSFVDGALKKTLHASVLLDEGVELLLCLNPLVPFDATSAREYKVLARGEERIPHMVDGGLPLVLSQTFRSLIHSRLALGMKGYASTHPKVDIVLFEPDHHDSALFLANTFSVSQRARLAEHAYQRTRETLRSHRASIGRKLERHGVTIDDDALADDTRRLISNLRGLETSSRTANAIKRLDAALDKLDKQLSSTPRRARAAGRAAPTRQAPTRRRQPK